MSRAGRRTYAARTLALSAALLFAAGCQSCPPDWVSAPPQESGWRYAAGTCHEVFIDADRTALALSRAARVLADELGLVLEQRLSVRHLDGRLFVEAVGADGLVADLDDLELVDLVTCGEAVHALVRLPAP